MASPDLREELTCPICLSIYTWPVSLRCGHNFCSACIESVFDHQFESKGFYSCPECLEEYPFRPSLEKNKKLCNITQQFSITSSPLEKIGPPCTYCVHAAIPAAKTCLQCETSLCDHHLHIHNSAVDHVLTDPTDSIGSRRCHIYSIPPDAPGSSESGSTAESCREYQTKTVNEAKIKKERLKKVLKRLTTMSGQVEKKVCNLLEMKRREQEKVASARQKCNAFFEHTRKQLYELEADILTVIAEQEENISSQVSTVSHKLKTQKSLLTKSMRLLNELCPETNP